MRRPLPSAERTAEAIRTALLEHQDAIPTLKKAAVRRVLHDAVTGLHETEVETFLDAVERHFPDRAWEDSVREIEAARRQAQLEEENASLRAQLVASEKDLRTFRSALHPFLVSALQPLDASPLVDTGDHAARRAHVTARRRLDALLAEPERLLLLLRAAGPIVHAFLRIDHAVQQPDAGLRDLFPKSGETLEHALQRLLGGDAGDTLLGPVQETLEVWDRMAPRWVEALRASWREGGRAFLDQLDPKSCENAVPRRVPGLREIAVLKEFQRRFEELTHRQPKQRDREFLEAFRNALYETDTTGGESTTGGTSGTPPPER